MVNLINQIFLLEQKCQRENIEILERNISRIYHEIEVAGFIIINPINRSYKNEMTDLEANINGNIHGDMKVVKVFKPIIYDKNSGTTRLLQKGIVTVE